MSSQQTVNISSWVEEYSDELFSWAYYKTSNRELAEDLVQECFLSAFKAIAQFKQQSNPKTWLFKILNNKIIDHYRSAVHRKMVNESALSSDAEQDFFDQQGSWKLNHSSDWDEEPHLLDNPLFNKVLQACLEALPERHRTVTMAKFFLHKKGDIICKELDITPSNLWQIVHRSKLQLKKCLDQNWKGDE